MSEIVVVITGATGPSGSGSAALNDLTDVTITSATNGQVLKYNGSAWVNGTDSTGGGGGALDDLTDVTITAAASGDILRHNGTAWVDTPGTTHFEVAGAVASHEADTTSVHGIADTSALETTTGSASKVSTHAALTSSVHGISAFGATLVDDASASAARTTLGVVIGTDVAAQSHVAATSGAHGISAFGATLVDDADAATARSTLGLVIGTNVQAFDQDLADIAAVTRTKGDLIVASSSAWTDLAVGTDGHVLTADSAQATGVKWAAASGGGASRGSLTKVGTGATTVYRTPFGLGRGPEVTVTPSYRVPQYFAPWEAPIDATIKAVAVDVTTALAGEVLRIGLIRLDLTDGQPLSLVADWGTVSVATTGRKEITSLTTTLTAGHVYCSVIYVQNGGGSCFVQGWPLPTAWGVTTTPVLNRVIRWMTVSGTPNWTTGFPSPPSDWDTIDTGINSLGGSLDVVLYQMEP